jgi:hypothetical protein
VCFIFYKCIDSFIAIIKIVSIQVLKAVMIVNVWLNGIKLIFLVLNSFFDFCLNFIFNFNNARSTHYFQIFSNTRTTAKLYRLGRSSILANKFVLVITGSDTPSPPSYFTILISTTTSNILIFSHKTQELQSLLSTQLQPHCHTTTNHAANLRDMKKSLRAL